MMLCSFAIGPIKIKKIYPQNLSAKCIRKIYPQNVSAKSIRKIYPQNLSAKSIRKIYPQSAIRTRIFHQTLIDDCNENVIT